MTLNYQFWYPRIKRFEEIGVKLILSDEEVIETCFDKYKTILFTERLNINFPKTYLTLDQAKNALKKRVLKFPWW